MERWLDKLKIGKKDKRINLIPWYVHDYAFWLPVVGAGDRQAAVDFIQLKPKIKKHASINCGADNRDSGPVYYLPIKSFQTQNLSFRTQHLLNGTLSSLLPHVKSEHATLLCDLPCEESFQARSINSAKVALTCNTLNKRVSYQPAESAINAFLQDEWVPRSEYLLGGIDSLVDNETLSQLASERQVMSTRNQGAPIASEGAAFIHLGQQQGNSQQLMYFHSLKTTEPSKVAGVISAISSQLNIAISALQFIYNHPQILSQVVWNHAVKQGLMQQGIGDFYNPHLLLGQPGCATFWSSIVAGLQHQAVTKRPQVITDGQTYLIFIKENS